MIVKIGDYKIPVEIVKKNNKNIYFRFKEDGHLYITCNYFTTKTELLELIKKDEKSLLRMYEKTLKRIEKENDFYYLGTKYNLIYNEDVKQVIFSNNNIYVKDDKMLDKWYKKECLKIFSERIEYLLNDFTNIPVFKLRIRKMKTRWGVNNTTKKIITLNSELLKKDITLIDYVIVHELCHFYEANHSKRFWYHVEEHYKDYKLARKRLRVE